VLTFCGYDLELVIDTVLDDQGGPTLWSGVDGNGGYWLIAEADRNPAHLSWLCAPISGPALQAIKSGRAKPADAFRHSATGTVEVVTVEAGQAVPDQCLRCEDVAPELLPPADWRLDAVGDGTNSGDRRRRPRDRAGPHW
jgi:hypothetical protein